MSKLSNAVKETRKNELQEKKNIETKKVVNFMGGDSFELNALDTLKMVTTSSIFGEPSYYRNGEFEKTNVEKSSIVTDGIWHNVPTDIFGFISFPEFENKKTSEIMESAIDNALAENFGAVLVWAKTLRKDYLMRLNPQVIMVRAAMHPMREEWTKNHLGEFGKINDEVMSRADDVVSQLTYWLYINGSKNNIPTILKRSWAKRLERMTRYEISKYKNKGIGLVDTVRISHANCEKNEDLLELMKLKKGQALSMEDSDLTWERLRSSGKSWVEILDTIKMPHMALLRNLRVIFKEVDDTELATKVVDLLVSGVKTGKQFPFRYMSASKAVSKSKTVNNKPILLDGLESCLDKACENLPKLKGKNAFLSDNSGSAWGSFTSEYGTVTVAEIGNLSSFIGAVNSDEGYVFAFGDRLIEAPAFKRQGILSQANQFSKKARDTVGGGTENGIWLFFKEAINNKQHWDNIFIYSDMQAGHGGLYGTYAGRSEYSSLGFSCTNWDRNEHTGVWKEGYSSHYINVAKLVEEYRKKVNPKVNVYCVQTAGYDNMVLPENSYRANFMYGWTGKELVYANAMNKFWDEKDKEKQ